MEPEIVTHSPGLWPYLSPIITAIGAIIMAWWKYDQTRRDARVRLETREREARLKEQTRRRNEYVSQIYGIVWELLHELQADRVYIVQPHPLRSNDFLTISFEVLRTGIAPMKERVQRLPMSDVAAFSAELASRYFIYYKDIEDNVRDKRARAIFLTCGTKSAVIRRMATPDDGWVGNIFCEFNHATDVSPEHAKGRLEAAAERIQFILPPVQ